MASISISISLSVEFPPHVITFRQAKPLSIHKYRVLTVRFSPPLPSPAIPISSKLPLFSTLQTPYIEPATQPRTQQEVKEEEDRQRRHNAITEFLVNECGFFHFELPIIMRGCPYLFRSMSTDRAQQALQLFRDSGFTADQIKKIILRNPACLPLKVDGLKPKIEFFKTLGFTGKDIGHIVSKQPRILSCSLEKNLTPKIPSLLKLFGSKAALSKALMTNPSFLFYSRSKMRKKLKFMESIGLGEDVINSILNKFPTVMSFSIDKMRDNMDFLTHTAGFHPSIVVKYPILLGFSIEKRMKPRFKVFEYLNEMQSSNSPTTSLINLLCLSEQQFTQKFLMDSPKAAKLYRNYKVKSEDLAVSNNNHSELDTRSERIRKSRTKRAVRVPAIGIKMISISLDDYSWRNYGQKHIKVSPHPR